MFERTEKSDWAKIIGGKTMRVVSLISSATEMVYKLGYGGNLCGRSHECDYPDEVMGLPVCTSPAFDVEGTSQEIDERVRELLEKGKPVYFVYDEILKSLNADVILTQTQCEVCSASLKDVRRSICSWSDFNADLVSMTATNLEGIYKDIMKVSVAIGDEGRGVKLVEGMKEEMRKWSDRAKEISYRPRVVFVEWIEPVMVAGNWIPELAEMADVEMLMQNGRGDLSHCVKWSEVIELDPDVLIFIPCGWNICRIKQEMKLLTSQASWRDLKAVREDRVYVSDGNQFFNRPGPRIFESFQIMLDIFYGKDFNFGYEGKYWERYNGLEGGLKRRVGREVIVS